MPVAAEQALAINYGLCQYLSVLILMLKWAAQSAAFDQRHNPSISGYALTTGSGV